MTKKQKPVEPGRGRPGRRSAAERTEAVRALLSGKASVEQLSQKYAVSQETIESWRAQGLEALEHGLRNGAAESGGEREARRELDQVKAALTRAVMEKELLQQALELERRKRPTGPSRWRK